MTKHPTKNENLDHIHCSFCGRSDEDVDKILSGRDGICICNSCVDHCSHILSKAQSNSKYKVAARSPKEIHAYLNKHIVGQDVAKRTISIAAFSHYKRILDAKNKIMMDKSNIILLGPTGTGKTLIARTLASFVGVPFVSIDATTLTAAGYVGADVESIISSLFRESNYNLDMAQKGIVFIDEIDKLSRKSSSNSSTRDIGGEDVQQALLKMIEGFKYSVHIKEKSYTIDFDSSNVLFICGGSFAGIESIIESRISKKSIGFCAPVDQYQSKDILANVTFNDLKSFGMIPEILGRLPVIVTLSQLTKEEMKKILTEPENAILKQFKKFFKSEKVDLDFTDDAIYAVSNAVMTAGTGARGLRSIVEKVLHNHLYNLLDYKKGSKVVIDKAAIDSLYSTPVSY